MPFFSPPQRPKPSRFKVATTDLKPSSEPSLLVETANNPQEDVDATHAHAILRKNIAPTMLLMPLEKLSRRPPRTSREKLRRERTKRKPRLESRRLKRKLREPRLSKNPLMRPRKSSTPSRKPSTNKPKSMPRKNKTKLSRKPVSKPRKKLPKFLMMPTKLTRLKPLLMPLIKPPPRSRKEPINPRPMPPLLKLLLKRPPPTPPPLEIRLPIKLKPPEIRPMPPLNPPRKPLIKLKVKLRTPRTKPPLNSEPHQKNE